MLKSHLLAFYHTCGHHTRDMTHQGLVKIIQKFGFEDKVSHNCSLTSIANITNSQVSWMVANNVTVNDTAIHYFCKKLDLFRHTLDPKEIRGQ